MGSRLDSQHEDVKALLETAVEYTQDDIFTDFEVDFIESAFDQIAKQGNAWEISTNRKQVLNTIESKLEKEGLL